MNIVPFTITISGWVLDVVELVDQWKPQVVRHQYPGQNGAELEWMGSDSGEFRVRTVFVGGTALRDYTELLGVLRKGAIVQVDHPVHGQFDALVEQVSAKYDYRIDTAEVDFTILEHAVGVEISYKPHAIDISISKTQAVLNDGVGPDLAGPVAPASLPDLDLTDPAWATKLNALGLGNKISSYVSKLATAVGQVTALRVALTAPVSAAFNAISFAADMPGQVAYQVALFLDMLATGRVAGAPDPVLAAQRLVADLRDLNDLFAGGSLESTVRVLGAMQGARTAAAVMATDEDNLRAQVALEGSVTFDSQGNRVGRQVGAGAMPATPDQVGRLVQASRQLISDAMPYTSAPEPMAELALALHRQYRDRLAQFETIREIIVVTPTPLHLICLQRGLPYNTAERLVLLNGMRNPSFTEGTVRIYAA